MKHHVERTSPKGPGQPFIGTCRLCGKIGLPASAALEDCENVRGLSVEAALIETITGEPQCDAGCGAPPCPRHWPDPTPEMLASPEFEAVWQCIKTWDINVPAAYTEYCSATGNHVRAILDALTKTGRWLRSEPDAWLVVWHRANGDAGTNVYTTEDEARRAAKNLEAYSASQTMADFWPLYGSPRGT